MRYRPLKWNIKDLKQSIQPQDFYIREQELCGFGYRTRQWVMAGRCPFHEDQQEGSFKVNLDNGAFICFSCGTKGGDIISFTQQKYSLSFKEVLEKLSYEWGVRC